ncbi:protein JINGUBANG [Apium graveolens]|uniref:protein JINGUBANG n=1 Tax=Apium graveolens TaxID=4045 RepID=UPI003D7AA9B9
MSYHQNYCSDYESQYHYDLFVQQGSSSMHSQPSLQSIPTLTTQTYQENHVQSIQHHCITTLKFHNSYISSLALCGKFLYIGFSDKEIRVLQRDILTSEQSELDLENLGGTAIKTGEGAVKSLVVLADKIFSAHQDHKIRVWQIDNHETDYQKFMHLATLPTLTDRAMKSLLPKNHVQVRRHKKSTWVHHIDTVSSLALSSDKSLIYSVSWDRTLKIWRASDFKCLESVRDAHDDAINAVALSEDGYVYTGSADKKIKVWKKQYGEKKRSLVTTLEKHKSGVNTLALSNDGSILFSGASDRSIVVWEKDEYCNMMVVGMLKGHTKSILSLGVANDILCSGSADATIRVWKGVEMIYSCLAVLEGHGGPVKCLTMASDHCANQSDTTSSYHLYSCSLDCDIKVWQLLVPNL